MFSGIMRVKDGDVRVHEHTKEATTTAVELSDGDASVTAYLDRQSAEKLHALLGSFLQDMERRIVCERNGFKYDPAIDAHKGAIGETELLARKARGEEISDEEFSRRQPF